MDATTTRIRGMKLTDVGKIVPALKAITDPPTKPATATELRTASQLPKDGTFWLDGRKYGRTSIIAIVVAINSPSIVKTRSARPYSTARKNRTNIVSSPNDREVMSCVRVILGMRFFDRSVNSPLFLARIAELLIRNAKKFR